jgi:hypothetical protein
MFKMGEDQKGFCRSHGKGRDVMGKGDAEKLLIMTAIRKIISIYFRPSM